MCQRPFDQFWPPHYAESYPTNFWIVSSTSFHWCWNDINNVFEQLQLSRKTQTIAPKLPEIGDKDKASMCIKITKMTILLVFRYPSFKMNRHTDNDHADNDDDDIIGGWIIVCAEFLIPSQTKRFETVENLSKRSFRLRIPSDLQKNFCWKADGHNISAYKKSSWYLKAFKSYPIFKVGDDNDNNDDDDNDDADTIGGWIIVCAEFLIPSQTKNESIETRKMRWRR